MKRSAPLTKAVQSQPIQRNGARTTPPRSSSNLMEPRLHPVERRVAALAADQLVVRAVLDDLALLDRDDPIGAAHRRQAVSDHQHGAALSDRLHVVLDR